MSTAAPARRLVAPKPRTWTYQLELPPTRDGTRRTLLRQLTGVEQTRDAAIAELDQVSALLALAGNDPAGADKIATMLYQLRQDEQLPNTQQVARHISAGTLADARPTLADYVITWIAERTMDESTQGNYRSHTYSRLVKHLGDIPLDRLLSRDIERTHRAIFHADTVPPTARDNSDLQARRDVKGQQLTGPGTQHRIRAAMRKALNDALHQRHRVPPARTLTPDARTMALLAEYAQVRPGQGLPASEPPAVRPSE